MSAQFLDLAGDLTRIHDRCLVVTGKMGGRSDLRDALIAAVRAVQKEFSLQGVALPTVLA